MFYHKHRCKRQQWSHKKVLLSYAKSHGLKSIGKEDEDITYSQLIRMYDNNIIKKMGQRSVGSSFGFKDNDREVEFLFTDLNGLKKGVRVYKYFKTAAGKKKLPPSSKVNYRIYDVKNDAKVKFLTVNGKTRFKISK